MTLKEIKESLMEIQCTNPELTPSQVNTITETLRLLSCDVPGRPHGHWIPVNPIQDNDGGAYMCSHCRSGDFDIEGTEAFCERCGAIMDEGVDSDGH